MANITLGDNTKLKISIPSKGDTNWNDVVKAAFQKIVDHDHSGLNGQGKKIKLQDLAQVNPTGVPQQGDTLVWDDNNQYFSFQTGGGAGGTGSGALSGLNHIEEASADTTFNDWIVRTSDDEIQNELATYLSLTIQQNIEENPPNASVLRGDRSFNLEKTATTAAFGYYAAVPFVVPKIDRGKLHTISLEYFNESSFVDGDIKVRIYDLDNEEYLPVIGEDLKSALVPNTHYAQVQLSNSTSFQLRLVVNSNTASSWDLFFDSVSVSPKVPVFVDGNTVQTISEYLLDKDVYAEADVDPSTTYSSSATTIDLGTQIEDTTNSLSLVTNKYTMPITGIYDISFMAKVLATASSTAVVKLMKEVNGSSTAMVTRNLTIDSNGEAPIDINLSRKFLSADKIYLELSCTSSATLEDGGFLSVSKKQSAQTLSESSETVAFHITNQVESTETTLPNATDQSNDTARKQVNVLPPSAKISTIVDTHLGVDATNRLVRIARSGLYKITTKVAIKDYNVELKKIQLRKFTASDIANPAIGNGNVANVASSYAVNAVSDSLDFEQLINHSTETPIGAIVPWAGGSIPNDWTACMGGELSQTSYKLLNYHADGNYNTSTTYSNAGVGSPLAAPSVGNFRVPDFRNSYIRGGGSVTTRGDNLDDTTAKNGLTVGSVDSPNLTASQETYTTSFDANHYHLYDEPYSFDSGAGDHSRTKWRSNELTSGPVDASKNDKDLNHSHRVYLVDKLSATETRPNSTYMPYIIKTMNFSIMEATFFVSLDAGDHIFVNARTDATGNTARLDLTNAFNFELKGERLK